MSSTPIEQQQWCLGGDLDEDNLPFMEDGISSWIQEEATGRAFACVFSALPYTDEEVDARGLENFEEFQEFGRKIDLICAAPSMLRALKALNAIRPFNWDDPDDPDQLGAWRLLDTALAEASLNGEHA